MFLKLAFSGLGRICQSLSVMVVVYLNLSNSISLLLHQTEAVLGWCSGLPFHPQLLCVAAEAFSGTTLVAFVLVLV